MSNLLEQWNDHIIKGNQLSREIETIEDIIGAGEVPTAEIAFAVKGGGTTLITVLSEERMQRLKESVVDAINAVRDDKVRELEKLMGTRKPAIINPVFEEATKDMFQSIKKTTEDPVEEKLTEILQEEAKKIEDKPIMDEKEVDNVRRMYHDEAKTMKEIAAYYGVTKSQMNAYISKYSLRRTSYKNDGFTDSEVGSKRKIVVPDPLKMQSNAIKCRICGKAIKLTGRVNGDTWPYKYKRGSEDIYCCGREHYLMGKTKDA